MSLTEEQKRRRMRGIGGSEVAAIVGLSAYAGPIDVFSAKVEGREVEDNHHMERGRFFERPTAEWYVHRYGGVLRPVDTVQSRKHPRVIVHPDFLVSTSDVDPGPGTIDLSIKVPGPRTWAQWGAGDSDDVPATTLVQLQYELVPLGELYGITRGVVAAPIDGDLRRFPVVADAELQAMLVEAVERFWCDHIETGRPPEPDGTERYSEYLAQKFPEARAPLTPAPPESQQWAEQFFAARAELAKWEAAEKEARQHLEAIIGEGEGIEGEGWRATWKMVKGRAKTDFEAACREAGVPGELLRKHTTVGNGYRRFLPTKKER